MAKSDSSLTFSVSADSTQAKPLVSINGSDFDPNEVENAIRTVRQMLPTDTFSRTVAPHEADAPKASAATPAAAAVGSQTSA